jgi:hypothetical protein
MRRTLLAALVAVFGLVVFATGAAAQAAPGFTELDSVSSAGVQGNQDSELPAVSADGRFVAFVSSPTTSSPVTPTAPRTSSCATG